MTKVTIETEDVLIHINQKEEDMTFTTLAYHFREISYALGYAKETIDAVINPIYNLPI